MYYFIIFVACLFKITSAKQLLVLAPPIKANEYYAEKFLDVIPFYVDYVNNVTGKDDVVLVADEETMPYYKGKINDSKLIEAHIDDPWIRDVSPPIPSSQVCRESTLVLFFCFMPSIRMTITNDSLIYVYKPLR